ncbi:MAG: disulfide bond formation protein DsbC, partial [Phototrophicales bacterium]
KLSALTKAKNGEEIEDKNCDNPVKKQYELGQRIGISGTPAIILDDGRLIPGYLPPQKLAATLNIK